MGTGRAGGSEIDLAFEAKGLTRRIALRVESFLLAAEALCFGDCVATLPAQPGDVPSVDLARLRSPLALPSFDLDMFWHRRLDARACHVFVREALLACTLG